MKCFYINEGDVVLGMPLAVPHAPTVKSVKGLIKEADFLLEISKEGHERYSERMQQDLSAVSELTYFELVPPDAKTKPTSVLVAFKPQEYRLAPECGDQSDILYRSPILCVVRASMSACYFFPIGESPSIYYFTINKKKLVRKKRTKAFDIKLERFQIEERRKEHTTVYTFSS